MNNNEISSKKVIGALFILLFILMFGIFIYIEIKSEYIYNRDILSSWNLAEKSSTLEKKAEYIKLFIENLEKAKLSEYNAVFLKTPDNNIQNNVNALKSLNERLIEIKDLDPESFAYQTAIQQITGQEQGEAHEMLSVIKGGWMLHNYPLIWGWIFWIYALLSCIFLLIGLILIMYEVGYFEY